MKSKEIAVVIGIALLVSVVVSGISGVITANVIRTFNNPIGSNYVYTVGDINRLFYNKTTIDKMASCIQDGAEIHKLQERESGSYHICGNLYNVAISYVDSDKIILKINNELTEKLSATGTTYGTTYKLSTGEYVTIKSINYLAKVGVLSTVEFSISKYN